MPVFSAFTPFGQLEFSSDASDAEKIYLTLRDAYRDPVSGAPAIDTTEGVYHEAKIYGWAMACADSLRSVRSAADELRGETSYYQLEAHEERFKMSPAATDTVAMRRAALASKQKAARGPRYEAMVASLQAIVGSDFVAYRPITYAEAVKYPADPSEGPGVFRRSDAIAKSVRILTAITRPGGSPVFVDGQTQQTNEITLYGTSDEGYAQSFNGLNGTLRFARFSMKKTGTPTGNAVAKLYKHTGTFGSSGVPHEPWAPLAVSEPVDVSTLTGTHAMTWFEFTGENRFELALGTNYFIAVEYTGGDAIDNIQVGNEDVLAGAAHVGNSAIYNAGAWSQSATVDVTFDIHVDIASRFAMEVAYENWNRSNIEELLVKGDVLAVDPGLWGSAEKVTVLSASGTGTSRVFTAEFEKPHEANTFASTGPTPLWANTKRHVLIVVKAASAASAAVRARIHELMQRVSRGPTTWSIVEPTTPGATTVGPFELGTSPLGVTPIEEIDIIPPTPPFFGPMPSSGSTGGGYTIRLFGEYLANASLVEIGGGSVSFVQVSDREITFVAPSLTEGKKDIAVTTPHGTTTLEDAFEYVQAELTVTSNTPDTGPDTGGTAVVVAGTGFWRAVDVQVNGFSLAVWSVVDDNTINCTTDAVGGPGTLQIVVHSVTGDTAGKDFIFT